MAQLPHMLKDESLLLEFSIYFGSNKMYSFESSSKCHFITVLMIKTHNRVPCNPRNHTMSTVYIDMKNNNTIFAYM